MLFYEFKLECKYAGEATLEKAFAESRREGWSAVANVNDALCEENDEERYASTDAKGVAFLCWLLSMTWIACRIP